MASADRLLRSPAILALGSRPSVPTRALSKSFIARVHVLVKRHGAATRPATVPGMDDALATRPPHHRLDGIRHASVWGVWPVSTSRQLSCGYARCAVIRHPPARVKQTHQTTCESTVKQLPLIILVSLGIGIVYCTERHQRHHDEHRPSQGRSGREACAGVEGAPGSRDACQARGQASEEIEHPQGKDACNDEALQRQASRNEVGEVSCANPDLRPSSAYEH